MWPWNFGILGLALEDATVWAIVNVDEIKKNVL